MDSLSIREHSKPPCEVRYDTSLRNICSPTSKTRIVTLKQGTDVTYVVSAPLRTRMSATESSTSQPFADTETIYTFCNAAKCRNKPPYYYPKSKAKGHNLQSKEYPFEALQILPRRVGITQRGEKKFCNATSDKWPSRRI